MQNYFPGPTQNQNKTMSVCCKGTYVWIKNFALRFKYINSLDTQILKTMDTRSQETGFSLSVYARCHGFSRANYWGLTIDMTQLSSTKARYRLMRPVNEWKLPHVKIDTSLVLI